MKNVGEIENIEQKDNIEEIEIIGEMKENHEGMFIE